MKRKSNIKRSMAIALAIFVLLQQLGAKTTVMAEETSTVSGGDMQTVTVSDGDAQTETESGGDSQTVSGDGSPTVSGGDVPTVSDGDNVVKKDTGAPVIDSVKYSIGSDALQELEEEETAFITGSGNLHLQVAVSDPETGLPDEEASGVQRVWIKARSQIHEMTYDQTEQVWKAEIAVSEGNYTVLKPSVFAQDKAGNEFQKEASTFLYRQTKPDFTVDIEGWTESGRWMVFRGN